MKRTVTALAVVAGVLGITFLFLKLTVLTPFNTASRLYRSASQLVETAANLEDESRWSDSKLAYQKALDRLETIEERYKDLPVAETVAKLAKKCRRKLAAYDSPRGALASLVEALSESVQGDEDEYLTYWDFRFSSEAAAGEAWEDLGDELQDKLVVFSYDSFRKYMEEVRSVASEVDVQYLSDKLDETEAVISTVWSYSGLKTDILFKLRSAQGRWAVYDFDIPVVRAGPVSILKESLAKLTGEHQMSDVVDAGDFSRRLEQLCFDAAMERETGPVQPATDSRGSGQAVPAQQKVSASSTGDNEPLETAQLWEKGYEEALKRAAKDGRPLFVMMTATWCGWCEKLEKETLSDPQVLKALASFVWVKVFEDKNVEKKLGCDGYPTLAFIDSHETVRHKIVGFRPVEAFMNEMGQVYAALGLKIPEGVVVTSEPKKPEEIEPDEVKIRESLAALATFKELASSDKFQALAEPFTKQVLKADKYVREERDSECRIVIGRVSLAGQGDVRKEINTQMDIMPGGYFIAVVGSVKKPLSFQAYGYRRLDVDLVSVDAGGIIDAGGVQVHPLEENEKSSLKAKLSLETQTSPMDATITLQLSQIYNTPGNCAGDSYGSYENSYYSPVHPEIAVNPDGILSVTGVTPGPYYLRASSKTHVGVFQRIDIGVAENKDLGEIKLETPEVVQVRYVGTGSEQQVKSTTQKAGQFWEPELKVPWELRFEQKDHVLRLDSNYGPVHGADLGEGKLDDHLKDDVAQIKTDWYPKWPCVPGHVYFFKIGGENWILFEVSSSSVEK